MLNRVKFFFKYLFRFRAPEIRQLNYIDYTIINKCYFLISWKSKYSYKLKIKGVYSTYYQGGGSAYVLIPSEIDSVEVIISNLWRSESIHIHLIKTEIAAPFEFDLIPNFKEWRPAHIHLPQPKLSSKKLIVHSTTPKILKPVITVENLSFLKP